MNFLHSKPFDLEERTFEFGKRINNLVNSLPKNSVNNRLGDQIVRSGNSIGANYREANETEKKRILNLKSEFVGEKAKKQSIGCG